MKIYIIYLLLTIFASSIEISNQPEHTELVETQAKGFLKVKLCLFGSCKKKKKKKVYNPKIHGDANRQKIAGIIAEQKEALDAEEARDPLTRQRSFDVEKYQNFGGRFFEKYRTGGPLNSARNANPKDGPFAGNGLNRVVGVGFSTIYPTSVPSDLPPGSPPVMPPSSQLPPSGDATTTSDSTSSS